jgi:hypothetical protein
MVSSSRCWKLSLFDLTLALPGSMFGVPALARSILNASSKLWVGEGVIARIVERAVVGRTGLGGACVGGRGRMCVDIFAVVVLL